MPLVMFLDACEHCARICNILRHCQNMSLLSTCQSMAVSYEFVELNHWQGRVLSQPSGNVLLLGVQILDVTSACEYYSAFQCCLHAIDKLQFSYYCSACYYSRRAWLPEFDPSHPAPRWNHHASHPAQQMLLMYWYVFSSNKVGGSGRQSLTRLSTHMNVP